MLLAGIILSLTLSALFSGAEIAFVSANKLKIELRKKRGTYRGLVLANFYDNAADFLSTMLVGNNIVLVIFTYLMAVPLENLLSGLSVGLAEGAILLINTLIITLIVLVFGEFIPKTIFRLYADEVLYFLALPLRAIELLLWVPSRVMTGASALLLRIFFPRPSQQLETALTRLDLEDFIKESKTEAEEEIDKELFGKALNLYDVRVRNCMVPRTEIENIDVNASIDELEALFAETHLSRLLVTEDDIDNVLGYVHHQQLLQFPTAIRPLILDLPFVPEVMRVTDLMDKFIKEQISLACVVDEFGGVAGIITLEDILEEIFGEIEDEYDEDEHTEIVEGDQTYLLSGRLEIDYLNEKFGLTLPEGEYHTLSGYLVTRATTIPEQGEYLEVDGYRFEFVTVSNTRIDLIRVIRLDSSGSGERPL